LIREAKLFSGNPRRENKILIDSNTVRNRRDPTRSEFGGKPGFFSGMGYQGLSLANLEADLVDVCLEISF